jgi:hypothetical protein
MKIKQLLLPVIALCMTAATSQAVVLAQYNFTGASAVASTVATDVTAGNFTPVGVVPTNVGLSGAGNIFLRSTITQGTEALALSDLDSGLKDYQTVTISAAPGKFLDLTSVTFGFNANNNNDALGGAFTSTAVLSSSVNGFGTAITGTNTSRTAAGLNESTPFTPTATFDLSAPAYNNLTTITFRLSTFDSHNDNGRLSRFDDFTLNGDVIPEPSSALLGSLGLLAILRRRRA